MDDYDALISREWIDFYFGDPRYEGADETEGEEPDDDDDGD